MPQTHWRIVTVMPQSAARQEAVDLFNWFFGVTIVVVLLAMALVWALLRLNLTQPLINLAQQLKLSFRDEERVDPMIKTREKGES